MAWYTSLENRENVVPLAEADCVQVAVGAGAVMAIGAVIVADLARLDRPVFIAIDGYKGSRSSLLAGDLRDWLKAKSIETELFNINRVFQNEKKIGPRIAPFVREEDPSFGRVYPGEIEDFLDEEQVRRTLRDWEKRRGQAGRRMAVLCFGMGASALEGEVGFDRIAYLDVTREQILVRADELTLSPLGGDDICDGFPWKRIHYVEYPVLNRHKKRTLKRADWYLDDSRNLKMMPRDVYEKILERLAGMPLFFKVFYMPGPFGGTEFGSRFGVKGLPNTSWNYKISIGDNHLLVSIGAGLVLEIPFYNLIWAEPDKVLGRYSSQMYPDHFPIAIYMQDGYFESGDLSDFKRTHMPHHLHPDTSYCQENFGEPLGRYETYYIVRADPGAITMHGFRDGADIDEYISEVKRSADLQVEFDWRKYVYEHPSRTGELHQLPPGTVHGTGGRQVILEIDTNPSRESTEYSFYLYDYCRPNFNYSANDFTGSILKLTLEHSLAQMRRNRCQDFMAKECRSQPVCLRRGEDWREMTFPMCEGMPYQVNRLEFLTRLEDETCGAFLCLTLTLGRRVCLYSEADPSRRYLLEDCDTIVLPACFGKYVCENLTDSPCEVVKVFLIESSGFALSESFGT